MFDLHANVDNRTLFRFEALNVKRRTVPTATGEREQINLEPAGWSLSLYATDKREAIKTFVALTSPTQRFNVTEVTTDLPMNTPFVDCLSRVRRAA